LNPTIISINQIGKATGLSIGSTSINYLVTSNGCSNSQTKVVNVVAQPVVNPIVGVNSICLNTGTTLTNSSPSGVWSSSSPLIATISPTGSILGVGVGNVTFSYAITQNGCTNSVQSTISISECAGLDEVQGVKFEIYPNPTKDELNIISSNESIEDLKIIDNAGRIIFESKPSSLNVKLEVGNFADGLYTIQISSASKMIISKFIVRK
jgi:hypothetical protein